MHHLLFDYRMRPDDINVQQQNYILLDLYKQYIIHIGQEYLNNLKLYFLFPSSYNKNMIRFKLKKTKKISTQNKLNLSVQNKRRILKVDHRRQHTDFLFLFIVLIISIFGLIMVYDASVVEASEAFGDRFHYLKFQAIYVIVGWILLFIVSRINYHIYRKWIKWLFIGNLILLVLVLVPGIGLSIKGAKRWIDLGFTTYQPSETFKTILVIYLAKWVEKRRSMGQFFALIAFVLGLIILQPDLGTAIVLITTSFVVYFVSGAPVMQFALASFSSFLIGLLLVFTSPYRRARITTFLNNSTDSLGSSYHVQQILLALGSGGLFGLGIGQSLQKYRYLPEAMGDSIFAIIGEEVGFLGALLFILLYIVILWKGFKIAQKASDIFGRLLAIGIVCWIGTQFCINLASMVSLVPLTGVPLPLISYGGTSLIITLVSIGILINISKQIES